MIQLLFGESYGEAAHRLLRDLIESRAEVARLRSYNEGQAKITAELEAAWHGRCVIIDERDAEIARMRNLLAERDMYLVETNQFSGFVKWLERRVAEQEAE